MANKLKMISTDLVSYIQIKAEAIETSNDKMMNIVLGARLWASVS